MALPRRRVYTSGAAPRDYPSGLLDGQGDWDDWTLRTAGFSSWSQVQQPGTSVSKLMWLQDAVNYGGAIHPRQKITAPNWEYEVHMVLQRRNDSVWKSCSVGPAVNMRDRGAGLVPDFVGVIPIFLSPNPLLLGVQLKAGVATFPFSASVAVVPGDILSLYHKEVSGVTTYHVMLNGKAVIALGGFAPVNPHTATDKPGVMGVATVLGALTDYVSQWWVTSSTGGSL